MTARSSSEVAERTVVSRTLHGSAEDGSPIHRFTLTNGKGWTVAFSELGATLLEVCVPDRGGHCANIVQSFADFPAFVADPTYSGRLIGRVANRVRRAHFPHPQHAFSVKPNEGEHLLHGGAEGLHRAQFTGVIDSVPEGEGLTLHYRSPHGEAGFPGQLELEMGCRWGVDGTLQIAVKAVADRPTPLNLTHHPYWNLSGDFGQDVLSHELQVNSSDYAEVDAEKVQTGQLKSNRLTPMDFRFRRPVGHALSLLPEAQYDHCLVLNSGESPLNHAVHVLDPGSGRNFSMWTNQSAVQFYTAKGLGGAPMTSEGVQPVDNGALCLEPHHPTGAVDNPALGNLWIPAGQPSVWKVIYGFFVS